MAEKGKQDGEQQRRIAGGYIMVARQLKESGIWSQPHLLRLWIYLLLSVRWDETPTKKGNVTINRGQVLKSFRRIADENEWLENRTVKRWVPSQVKRMLEQLELRSMCALRGTELGTLITVLNFNDYPDPETYRAEPGTELGTQLEQQRNNRKKEKKENTTISSSYSDEAVEVFDYWQDRRAELPHTHPAQPTVKRLSKVQARLNDGFSVKDLQRAVDGCLSNSFNVERGYYDLELICRNDTKVTQYLAWASRDDASRPGPGYRSLRDVA